nr:Lsr2 family protein [Streptomyces sulphureus]
MAHSAILMEGPVSVAQRVVVTLSDDLEGGDASETVAFALDGKSYEIDLNADNAKKLREELAPFVEAGRKRAKSGKAYHRTSVEPDARAVRAWAESNGYEVPARGRIPKRIYEAFQAAH